MHIISAKWWHKWCDYCQFDGDENLADAAVNPSQTINQFNIREEPRGCADGTTSKDKFKSKRVPKTARGSQRQLSKLFQSNPNNIEILKEI